MGLLLFSYQNFTNSLLPLLVGNIAYFFKQEKRICDNFLWNYLTKVNSAPKT